MFSVVTACELKAPPSRVGPTPTTFHLALATGRSRMYVKAGHRYESTSEGKNLIQASRGSFSFLNILFIARDEDGMISDFTRRKAKRHCAYKLSW